MSDELKWDSRYRGATPEGAEPARVLAEFAYLLPHHGSALDLACGLGGNALFLASRGLEVSAWDISSVAIGKLQTAAERRGVSVMAQVRDVVATPPEPEHYDVIVVSRFLERGLMPAILAALRPGGLLFYQTFIRARVHDIGPSCSAYRLDCNELLSLCGGLQVLVYREEGRVGDTEQGMRDEAMLIGQRAVDLIA